METIHFDEDITIFYVTAPSFPDRVMEAFDRLHAAVPFTTGRKFISVSRCEDGKGVVYHAGAEELHLGEGNEMGFDTLVLKKGDYLCLTVKDFMKDIPAIGKTFDVLIQQQGVEPGTYYVEWYFNETDVRCMMRLTQ